MRERWRAIKWKLLEIFIQTRGRVLSRERLLEAVWGPDTFASDRIMDNQQVCTETPATGQLTHYRG